MEKKCSKLLGQAFTSQFPTAKVIFHIKEVFDDHITVAKPPSPSKQHMMITMYKVGVAVYGRYATLSSPPVSYLAHISGSIAGVTIGEVLQGVFLLVRPKNDLSARPLGNSETFLKGFTCNLTFSHFSGRTNKKNTLYALRYTVHLSTEPRKLVEIEIKLREFPNCPKQPINKF